LYVIIWLSTHCKYIHRIAEDHDIKHQLYIRFVKFIQSLHKSSNAISQLCVKLLLRGSRSNISNNMSLVCNYYSVDRNNLLLCTTNKLKCHLDNDHTLSITSMMRELLYMKYHNCINVNPLKEFFLSLLFEMNRNTCTVNSLVNNFIYAKSDTENTNNDKLYNNIELEY
jgi:hypothetical protein